MSFVVIAGHRTKIEDVAQALMEGDPRVLADTLEAMGTRAGVTGGADYALGAELRRLARELRDNLSETTVVDFRPSGVRRRAS